MGNGMGEILSERQLVRLTRGDREALLAESVARGTKPATLVREIVVGWLRERKESDGRRQAGQVAEGN